MSTSQLRWVRFFAFLMLIAFTAVQTRQAVAQDVEPAPDPRPSPLSLAQITLEDGTYVKIHYSSPRKRGREIFGGLEPYNEVWRFGANEATEMTTTQPILFGDEELPAGTYALFAIPREDTWTIIVNENLGQWGAFSYSEDGDVLRIDVPAQQADKIYEAFTIRLEENEDEPGASMVAVWDDTMITVPVAPLD